MTLVFIVVGCALLFAKLSQSHMVFFRFRNWTETCSAYTAPRIPAPSKAVVTPQGRGLPKGRSDFLGLDGYHHKCSTGPGRR